MSTFMLAFFTVSLTMSVVIVLLLVLNKVLENKISAGSRYYIWIIALLGLLIPFRPSIDIPFKPLQIPISFETTSTNISASNIESEISNISPQASDIVTNITPAAISAEKQPVSYTAIILAIWISGILAIFTFHLYTYIRFTKSVRRWGININDEQITLVFQKVLQDMKLSDNKIALKKCIFIPSPMLIGFRNSTILLPEREIPSDELEHIFRHELTHYKRKDLWVNLLILLVSAIHWFNPFVYIMAKTIRENCEAACDEAAVAGNDTNKRRQYCETIIGFIGIKNKMTPVLSTYFYGGNNSMKKRLFSIMDMSKKRKDLATICLLAIVALTLLSGNVFAATNPFNNNNQHISEAEAKTIALNHAGLSAAQVTFIKSHLERDNGRMTYDVEFYSDNVEYDYEIDAVSGSIIEFDRDIEHYSIPNITLPSQTDTAQATNPPADNTPASTQPASNNSSQYIGETEAQSIALEHAGLSAAQVTFIKSHLDRDNGRTTYDVEFYSGNVEYDYEIDAVSGSIIEFDRDIEHYSIPNITLPSQTDTAQATNPSADNTPTSTQPAPNSSSQYISEAEAQSIALNHAGLSAAQVTFIKSHLERDNGRMTYDVEFYSSNVEYDYEIDAVSGSIIEFDRDIEHYSIPNINAQTTNPPADNTPASTQPAQSNSSQYIGEAKAQSIALSASGLSSSQVRQLKVKLDRENGVMVYEVEFKNGRTEYDYDIDALTGNILKSDVDYDD